MERHVEDREKERTMDRYREQAREILNTVNRVIYGKEELTEKI